MSNVSGPRGAGPIKFNAPEAAPKGGPAWAVGTFKPKGWGIASPLKELTLDRDGGFKASLRGGGSASGKFEFRDGAAAFMDTLKLTQPGGKELLFAVAEQTKDANGKVTALKLAPLTERGVGTPFTLELR